MHPTHIGVTATLRLLDVCLADALVYHISTRSNVRNGIFFGAVELISKFNPIPAEHASMKARNALTVIDIFGVSSL